MLPMILQLDGTCVDACGFRVGACAAARAARTDDWFGAEATTSTGNRPVATLPTD